MSAHAKSLRRIADRIWKRVLGRVDIRTRMMAERDVNALRDAADHIDALEGETPSATMDDVSARANDAHGKLDELRQVIGELDDGSPLAGALAQHLGGLVDVASSTLTLAEEEAQCSPCDSTGGKGRSDSSDSSRM